MTDKGYSFEKSYRLAAQTPMIHFQWNQQGATLRASEVKPKLDKFLITKLEGFEKVLEEKYLFFRYNNLYISLYFDNGYRVNKEDEFTDKELLSEGRQNAVVCRVEYCRDFDNIDAFADYIKSKPVDFDRDAKTVSFDGIVLRTDGNSENGKENIYPYAKTYDCPFMQSDWDSKKIVVTFGDNKVIYDFVNNRIETKN